MKGRWTMLTIADEEDYILRLALRRRCADGPIGDGLDTVVILELCGVIARLLRGKLEYDRYDQ